MGDAESNRPADPLAVREKVRQILTDILGRVEIDRDGDFSFPFGSTRIFVSVSPWGESSSVVSVFAFTNLALAPSPELFEYVARHASSWLFGHLGIREDDGTITITFRHSLLGEFLEPEELKAVIRAVANTADDVDDEIRKTFGGRLFNDPVPEEPASQPADSPAPAETPTVPTTSPAPPPPIPVEAGPPPAEDANAGYL